MRVSQVPTPPQLGRLGRSNGCRPGPSTARQPKARCIILVAHYDSFGGTVFAMLNSTYAQSRECRNPVGQRSRQSVRGKSQPLETSEGGDGPGHPTLDVVAVQVHPGQECKLGNGRRNLAAHQVRSQRSSFREPRT